MERRDRTILVALCATAAFRVLLFGAAFPFFNNVDEQAHFDLVVKYSQGSIPRRGVERFSPETLRFVILYGSPEYLSQPGSPARTPGWRDPSAREPIGLSEAIARLQGAIENHESGGFPLYYVAAGCWLRLGRIFGLEGGRLLYWIRFLNAVVLAGLVWLSSWIARTLIPSDRLARFGLPLLLAFLPQNLFYSVTSDVPSAILFGLAFALLTRLVLEDTSAGFHVVAGLVVAATFLTKFSNITVLGLLALVIAVKIRVLHRRGDVWSYWSRFGALLAAGLLPAGAWLLRNRIVLGDVSGSAEKVVQLHWTIKPLAEWWPHPLFSLKGLGYFLVELTKTFWRGELVWHLERIASPAADFVYVVTTAMFVAASAVALWRGAGDERRRFVLLISFSILGASVLLLSGLSILFDFDGCWYPSRERPYFVSGRLISGALVPFMLVYLDGLRHVLSWARLRVDPLVVVALLALTMTVSELTLTAQVFRSPYNWFHLG